MLIYGGCAKEGAMNDMFLFSFGIQIQLLLTVANVLQRNLNGRQLSKREAFLLHVGDILL